MTRVALSLAGAYGVFLLYTSVALGWRGLGVSPGVSRRLGRRIDVQQWLTQVGLNGVGPSQFFTAVAVIFGVVTALAYSLLGAFLPALAIGGFAATYPAMSYRARRRRRRQRTAEA